MIRRTFAVTFATVMAMTLLVGWSSRAAAEDWEVLYDGVGSAADNVPNHLRWDSAIDDDWNQPGVTFRLDTPSPGFMSVDRVTDPADHGKTGNIWMRDPILNHADGFTMEVGVRLLPNSNPNAFSMTYLDNGSSFGVHLSPNQIKAGSLASGGTGVTAPLVTTDAIHNYRIVKLPNSHTVRVYVDDNPTPIITGTGNTNYITGSSPFLQYPRILIGDNENNPIYNANYVLDYVRYRRGATAPGVTPPTFSPRVLPPMPTPAPPSIPGVPATPVWRSTFDATADGVVSVLDNNFGKEMVGSVVDGKLQIESWDNTTDSYTPDKAGRSLGDTFDGNDSLSASYKFSWSSLNSDATQAYEAVGFFGSSVGAQTRQILGSIMRHWKAGDDYYVGVDVAASSVGYTGFGYLAGPAINLGPDAISTDYEFRVSYNGSTRQLGLDLLTAQGERLGGQFVDLDTDVPGLLQAGTPAKEQELNAYALTHVGWSDYTGNGGDRPTIWQVDSLTFDTTPDGAFDTPTTSGENWTVGFDGTQQPMDAGWIHGGGSNFFPQPGGIMELNTLGTPANARMDNVTGWSNMSALTLEARIKVLPDSEEGGFNLIANDTLGDTSLVLSTDKVQLMHSGVPVGAATVDMDTTDDFHIYRMTRDVDGLYWHLYIDDNPVASIAHQHAGGTLLEFSRIWFGDVAYPVEGNGAHVLIDYIRWHEGANAPPGGLPGDYDHDNDVDTDDYTAWARNYGSTAPDADGNRDGTVDAADYVIWSKFFSGGGSGGSATESDPNSNGLVPEPTSLATVIILLVTLFSAGRANRTN